MPGALIYKRSKINLLKFRKRLKHVIEDIQTIWKMCRKF